MKLFGFQLFYFQDIRCLNVSFIIRIIFVLDVIRNKNDRGGDKYFKMKSSKSQRALERSLSLYRSGLQMEKMCLRWCSFQMASKNQKKCSILVNNFHALSWSPVFKNRQVFGCFQFTGIWILMDVTQFNQHLGEFWCNKRGQIRTWFHLVCTLYINYRCKTSSQIGCEHYVLHL